MPFAYLAAIVLDWGVMGVLLAITFAEVLIAVIGMIWFRKGTWKVVKV